VTGWSSGTGMAGVGGAGIYLGLRSASFPDKYVSKLKHYDINSFLLDFPCSYSNPSSLLAMFFLDQ